MSEKADAKYSFEGISRVIMLVAAMSGVGSLGGNAYLNTQVVTKAEVVELITDKAYSKDKAHELDNKLASYGEKVNSLDSRLKKIEESQQKILANINQLIVKVDAVTQSDRMNRK
jgi:hypothetical protein